MTKTERKERQKKLLMAYKKIAAGKPAGEGSRFVALAAVLKAKGAKNPEALAAWIGRKKYGKKMSQFSVKGRKGK